MFVSTYCSNLGSIYIRIDVCTNGHGHVPFFVNMHGQHWGGDSRSPHCLCVGHLRKVLNQSCFCLSEICCTDEDSVLGEEANM